MTTRQPNRIDLLSPAEKAIWDAMGAVEALHADVRLTDAVNLLSAARDSVFNALEHVDNPRFRVTTEPSEPKPKATAGTMTDALTLLRQARASATDQIEAVNPGWAYRVDLILHPSQPTPPNRND